MKMALTVCINASKSKVWDVLSDVENIPLWSSAVRSAKTDSLKRGVGTVRTCELQNNTTIFEKWIDWRENESYTYQGFNLPLVKFAQNTWSVEALDENMTLLKTNAEIVLKGGLFGKCLEPLVRLMSARLGHQSLAALKYLVEENKPFDGPHSSLPKPSGIC